MIITNDKIFKLTISGKSMDLYDLNKNLKVARLNSFIFIEINGLPIKFFLAFTIYKHKLLSKISKTDVR